MNVTNHLFVYGTLKRGGDLHGELISQGAYYAGAGRIRGRLFHVEGESFPGAVQTEAGGYVQGELYRLEHPRKALRAIDKLEGCDEGLFERKRVDVWTRDYQTKAWAYFYARPLKKSPRLSNGRFETSLRNRAVR